MRFAPGSVAWLVAFDLRLAFWRFGRTLNFKHTDLSWRQILGETWVALLLLHVLGLLLVLGLRFVTIPERYQLLILSGVLLFAWLVALGSAVYFATAVLFLRGDMDLLCSSPLPLRTLFTARAMSIGLQSCLWPALLGLPAANIALLFGDPRWLAAYPVLLALGLSAAAVGLMLAVALVRLFGPRRARTIAVLLGALFGASWFLVFQIPAVLGNSRFNRVITEIGSAVKSAALSGGHGLWWYPARALQGELVPLITVLLVALAFFGLVALFLPRGFLFAMQRAVDTSTPHARAARRGLRFHRRFGVTLFLKEWRLVLRDPWLLGHLGRMLIIALVFVAGMMLDPDLPGLFGGKAFIPNLSAYAVIMAGGLADSLVWLAVCAEDLPDLIAGAPRPVLQLLALKHLSMLIPIWLVTLAGALWLAWFDVWAALWLMVAMLGATTSAGLVHLLHPVRASRTDLMRRMRVTEGMPITRVLASMLNLFGWAAVAYCFVSGHWLAGLIVLAIVGAVAGTRIVNGWQRLRWAQASVV